MTRAEAYRVLTEMTETPSLLRHARCVELVMQAFARHYGENEEIFSVAGLLHDADYDKHPDRHPHLIVERLEGMGELEIAHAIKGHYTKWNVERRSLLDKCIVAADELTGFIYAAALIRPAKIEGLTPESVIKKLKTKSFAASVDREEVAKGAELIGWEIPELIRFIIQVLEENREELEL
ncbi:MAG: HD domain-containing protein [Haliscomenobacter sp.]|nr:HD domain-containing protein [Haliscomenobacter sp.]MBK7476713.1 HD domain-containing protein [Haliscomenobacter sp.]MBK8880167.1 HD domain-containing protein [Haliscomenobacter sp.]